VPIMDKYLALFSHDTWIIDDVFPVNESSELNMNLIKMGYRGHWVKLICVDDSVQVPVRYILVDDHLVSYRGFNSEHEGQISSGRSFTVDWNYPDFKRKIGLEKSNQTINIWYLGNRTLAAVNRKIEVEKFIATEYDNILKEVQSKEIPESNLLSDNAFVKSPKFKLHVMNVGQGDTIVLGFPRDRIWLIDAYLPSKKYQHVISFSDFFAWLKREYPKFVIERFIISHLHYDHIMSALSIIENLSPQSVIFNHSPVGKTMTALKALSEANCRNVLYALGNMESRKSRRFSFKFVNACNLANKAHSNDHNHHGIIMDLVTKNSHLLLPGDASFDQIDEYLRPKYASIKDLTKYYKVTHHCSKTGNDPGFLMRYRPDYAFTSCSTRNRYGHPDPCTRMLLNCVTNGSHLITCEYKQKSVDKMVG